MQLRNPWYDGPEYITQCPIQPGTNFTYEVLLSTEEGTVWWHAHSDWTHASVHGAIVILPSVGSTYPFDQPDEDEVIVLASWYMGDLKARVDEAMEEGTLLPHSDAYTITGEPGDLCPCSKDTTYHRKVDHGKTYLLRIVNANIDAYLFFAVAQHNLVVVGLDGSYTKPINTTYILISPGQTMDVLLKADQALGRYYMSSRHFSSDNAEVTEFDHVNVTAILEYNGNYTHAASPLFPDNLPMYLDFAASLNFTYQIKSLASPEYPITVPPDHDISTRMFITVSMNSLYCEDSAFLSCTEMPVATSVNNISWVNPSTDLLQAYYRNISGIQSTDFPDRPPSYYNFTEATYTKDSMLTVQGTKVKVLSYNESVEIVFQGTDVQGGSVNHPLHMHGYNFYVVGYGSGNYDRSERV